ncbi:MAG: hypothetical protein MNPFHGCM_02763 [Gemmatimonadaceae bacterium]|nr:hypothetical protein [Gemmatimonadaceae bacterium]
MRTTVFVGTSLDGFIARPDGALDFLDRRTGEAEPHGYEEFFATVDALVMGRNTFDTVMSFNSWPYGTKPVFVLSNRPLPAIPDGATVERLSGAPSEVVSQLSARGFGNLYVDGGHTVQAFLQAGQIDRLIVTRVPVLIGSGIPLFGAVRKDVPLDHIATKVYRTGLVQSEYAVVKETG